MQTIEIDQVTDEESQGLRFRVGRGGNDEDVESFLTSDVDPIRPQPNTVAENGTSASSTADDPSNAESSRKRVRPLIKPPQPFRRARRFEPIQQWEAIVQAVYEEVVEARLIDLTQPSNPDSVAEILIKEIPEEDRPLLKPGTVFYWSIGYRHTPGGQIYRQNELRVKRTPVWNRSAMRKAKDKARLLRSAWLGNDDEKDDST